MTDITFTSYSDEYTTEQGTPFVIRVVTDSVAASINPVVSSQLPPPAPPPLPSGGFDNTNYYSTAYIYLNSKRSRITTVTTKGLDDAGSGAERELKLKVYNRRQPEITQSSVFFQVDQPVLSSSFDTFKIVHGDSGSDVTDVLASNVNNSKLQFSLPRMDDNITEYTLKYKTKTNYVAAISDFTDLVNGTTKEIGENTVENTEIFAFTASTVDGNQTTSGVTYTITSGNSGNHFFIDGNKLKATSTPINYETYETTTVSISLTIKGESGGANISKDFTVTVTDMNDQPTDITFTIDGDIILTDRTGKVGDLSITDEDSDPSFSTYTFDIFKKDTSTAHDILEIKNQTEVHKRSGVSLSVGDNAFTVLATGSDSVAGHTLSKNISFSTRLRGDLNNDASVSSLDLMFLRKYLNEDTAKVNEADQDNGFNAAADLNADSRVDVADLIFMQNHLNQVSGYEIVGTSF